MAKRIIRLLVVDDHPVVVVGIRASLAGYDTIKVIGDARDGDTAIRKVRELLPDVVLLDISLPKRNGLEVMKALLAELPQVRFLIHTVHDDDELLYEFKRAGASGYILKDSTPNQLRKAILAVSNRKRFFTSIGGNEGRRSSSRPVTLGRSVSSVGLHRLQAIRKQFGLTPAETEIVGKILKGMTMRQIAQRVTVSYFTITSHFKHIYKKLGAHTRAQAIARLIGSE